MARKPRMTVGTPWIRNIHCQPARPCWPAAKCSRIQPENGPPSSPDTGIADMNRAMMRPRRAAGNQRERYSTTPGKKPASAAPVSRRNV
ncbi:hypothetical protein D3C76_1092010 [compost metagenome]